MKIFEGLRVNTLTLFVDKYLEKKAFFVLCNETMKFVFSEPGPRRSLPCVHGSARFPPP